MTKPDWETVKEEYYIGRKVEGTVRKVWKFGALIELDDGVAGVVRNNEMSWDDPVEDATTFLYEGRHLRGSPYSASGERSMIRGNIKGIATRWVGK
jgi:ribosomal protein S1